VATRERAPQLDIRETLRALWARKWWALLVAVTVSVGVAAVTLRQPKVYEAVCSLEYDPNPPRPLGDDVEDVASPGGEFWMNREFYETQNRIIASRHIAERVVRRLNLNHDAEFMQVPPERRESWRGASLETAARRVQDRLTVEAVRNTRLVLVRVSDGDPERAAALANATVEAYIEKTMEDRLGSTVTALEWLHEQLDTLRGQLDDAELALHRFKDQNNVLSVSLEDRQNLVSSEIQHFNEALTAARTRRIELSARLRQLREADRENPEEVYATALIENQAISRLRDTLRTKQNERSALAVGHGENWPALRALDEQIADLQRQLRNEINGLMRAAEADLAEARNIEAGIQAALGEANQAGLELNLREIEYRSLDRTQKNKAQLYEIVLQRTTETDLTRMLRVTHVRMVDRALAPQQPVSPNVPMNIAIGLAAGLALGIGLAFLLAFTDSRVKNLEAAEALGLTVLGVLPELAANERKARAGARRRGDVANPPQRDLTVHTHPRSAMAEACRTLRTNLAFLSADRPLEAIVVTSPAPSDGKTTVAISLAIAFAQSGKRVLLVDSDMRRPRLHRTLGVPGRAGLTTLLVTETSLPDVVQATEVPGLHVLPCGPVPPNPAELLHTARFGKFVEDARAAYDHIIFDSPPVGAVTDAAILAPQLDGVLIVLRANRTHRRAVHAALRHLRDVGANVVGGVLNCLPPGQGRYGNYYYYNNYYYSSDQDDDSGGDQRLASSA
jgi:succinoglycan biosynthesis transport protein ExoP